MPAPKLGMQGNSPKMSPCQGFPGISTILGKQRKREGARPKLLLARCERSDKGTPESLSRTAKHSLAADKLAPL